MATRAFNSKSANQQINKSTAIQYLLLGKPQITFPVSLSALTGYFLFTSSFSWDWLPAIAGVFLMSFASSAINQMQDADVDALMNRTRKRPIPAGNVKKWQALLLAVLTGSIGFLLLLYNETSLPARLSLITLICYNLVYTPLKRLTAFAVIPGALVGALPPVIGWTAAGGQPFAAPILFVAFFFFVGQIPHFWLILLKYGDDYEKAGLPTLNRLFSRRQIMNMTLGWVAATVMAALLLPLTGVIHTTAGAVAVILLSTMLLLSLRNWLKPGKVPDPHHAFMAINLYYLAMMGLLIIDAMA